MPSEKEIWVVGHAQTNADKSFSWDDENRSITDADVIIVDTGTLPTTSQLKAKSRDCVNTESIDTVAAHLIDDKQREIKINTRYEAYLKNTVDWISMLCHNMENKVLGGGHVVLLLHYADLDISEYYEYDELMPFNLKLFDDETRSKIIFGKHYLKEYLNHVKHVNYKLGHSMDVRLAVEPDLIVVDNSDQLLGAEYRRRDKNQPGRLTLLPSAAASGHGELITKIVASFKKNTHEPPPTWIENIPIPRMNEIVKEIERLQTEAKTINTTVEGLESEKNILGKYYDLLFSTGTQLEESVKQAFSLLGFGEINKKRGNECEDWVIDLKSIQEVEFGVMEVKGRQAKTTMADIGQCHKWTEEYLHMEPSVKTKGIFVSNQFRLHKFPESKTQRKRFEPNELEYAQKRDVCIIPTYVLFEAVSRVLEGQSPDRSTIEKKIFSANGILETIL